MKTISTGVLALLSLGGCIVVRENRTAPPLPPPATVTVSYGWDHHRYVVWREYYGCTTDEVYWLENCGYDDDDILACLTISRRARVPVRHVFYEYDRCGRSLFTVSAVFRLPIGIFFCNEVPVNYSCPPTYARAYGYYWRNQHHYYTNAEIHSLVQLQVGIRYYGYNHAVYFRDYDQCVQRNDRAPFRTIVVREPHRAGSGGRSCDERPIVKVVRPWDRPDPKDWERHREQERREVKVRYTPERERQEQEQARREAERDERRRSFEEAKAKADAMKREREEEDRRNPPPPVRRVGPADPPQKVADPRGPEQPRKPEPLGPGERRVGPAPEEPRKEDPRTEPPPGRKPVEEQPKGPPPGRKPIEEQPKGPPPGRKPIEEQPKGPPPGRKPVEDAPKENPGRKPIEEQPKSPPPGRKPVEDAPKENPGRKPIEEQPKSPPPGRKPAEEQPKAPPPPVRKPVEQPKAPPPADRKPEEPKSGGKSDAPNKGNGKGDESSDEKGNNKKPK